MFCENCGKEIDDKAVFCVGCGCSTVQVKKVQPKEKGSVNVFGLVTAIILALYAIFHLIYSIITYYSISNFLQNNIPFLIAMIASFLAIFMKKKGFLFFAPAAFIVATLIPLTRTIHILFGSNNPFVILAFITSALWIIANVFLMISTLLKRKNVALLIITIFLFIVPAIVNVIKLYLMSYNNYMYLFLTLVEAFVLSLLSISVYSMSEGKPAS